jgi:hypothetical protein
MCSAGEVCCSVTQCAYDRSIDFPSTAQYEAESHIVRIPNCLHMEYLHFLYYCQH